jgi:hypothetical protein
MCCGWVLTRSCLEPLETQRDLPGLAHLNSFLHCAAGVFADAFPPALFPRGNRQESENIGLLIANFCWEMILPADCSEDAEAAV